jgi:hypothetical protein
MYYSSNFLSISFIRTLTILQISFAYVPELQTPPLSTPLYGLGEVSFCPFRTDIPKKQFKVAGPSILKFYAKKP